MELKEKLNSRLANYKFASALKYIEGESEDIKNLITALNNNFGDIGWFDGDMAIIVHHALKNISVNFYD